ncbi:hypothetical protein [Paraburkholderia solisilvae]|uniref:hypothetical protein n=1 Tax=Paraburkholderia solisilvae TaxID=624376 RepID=UPI001582403A|nr:hypothetical protein [Paraburkholderia solisilvae]
MLIVTILRSIKRPKRRITFLLTMQLQFRGLIDAMRFRAVHCARTVSLKYVELSLAPHDCILEHHVCRADPNGRRRPVQYT